LVTDVLGSIDVLIRFGVKRSKVKVTAGGDRGQQSVEFHL